MKHAMPCNIQTLPILIGAPLTSPYMCQSLKPSTKYDPSLPIFSWPIGISYSLCHLTFPTSVNGQNSRYSIDQQIPKKKEMKIFNWVHRKFQQKDGNKKDIEFKISNEIIGHDTQVLLQDASFAHMLDIWKGGSILTIGTFGFDPLKNVQSDIDIEQEEISLEEEEEYYSVGNDIQECNETTVADEGNEELYPLIYANIGVHEVINEEAPKENLTLLAIDSNKMMKKERITLADLFSADSDHHHKADSPEKSIEPEIFTKKSNSSPQLKNGLSFTKKLIRRVKDEQRPIQKLQKLMTKVLKRKVHPDIETKIGKNNSQVKAASMLGLSCVKHFRVESSVSLLQTDQDITV
ncbi:protein TILLER ANGLE CONTROL 1-like isoform X2 [Lycium ferocissimum]|uniref:protein TILLER ANGLE CONTROL 1-like isoform X2 n=1 Tax=Lycium ferocissimum TaxID=112874 RepID=UPI0028152A6C|nr:protein TILLER ANGLE CONTROL 1-like isoform X2 [Lycium ferocissimum]